MKLLEKSHNHTWLYALLVLGLLSQLLLPASAFAADQGYGSFWFGPDSKSSEGVVRIKSGVVARTKYDAALYSLGFSKSTVSGISNAKKQKLINNSTFSSFANNFKTGKPDDDFTVVGPGAIGVNANSIMTAWYAAAAVYGEGSCFWAIYSEDAADAAYSAAQKIIKSGDEVGGGDPVVDTSVALLPVEEWYENNYGIQYVMINESVYSSLLDYQTQHSTDNTKFVILAYVGGAGGSTTSLGGRVMAVQEDTFSFSEDGSGTLGRAYGAHFSGQRYVFSLDSGGKVVDYEGKMCFDMRGGRFAYTGSANAVDNVYPIMYRNYGDATVVDPDPPTDWPDPDPPVTPPEPPEPIEPDPPLPWTPIPGIDIDITGEDFQDLLDALNEHCLHLQSSIQTNVSQLWQLQSDLLTNQFQTLGQNIHNDLVWLGECLNVDVNVNVDDNGNSATFDDSSVIYWLKQIWTKLGDGFNVEPTDPVVSGDDWWAWLLALISNFAAMLLSFGSDKLGAVTSALGALTSKFPFSLPWDLAALLALLDAPVKTPEFDLPCFAVTLEGLQEVGNYHISLADYNQVWENIRWIERLSFIVLLIKSSDWFTGLMRKAVGRS